MENFALGLILMFVQHLIVWKILTRKNKLDLNKLIVLSAYSLSIMVGSGLLASAIANMTGIKLLILLTVVFFFLGVRAITPKAQNLLGQDRKTSYALFGKAVAINFLFSMVLMYSMLFLLARLGQ
jgi:hypothetical protein